MITLGYIIYMVKLYISNEESASIKPKILAKKCYLEGKQKSRYRFAASECRTARMSHIQLE